jgi:hypothetical protein
MIKPALRQWVARWVARRVEIARAIAAEERLAERLERARRRRTPGAEEDAQQSHQLLRSERL